MEEGATAARCSTGSGPTGTHPQSGQRAERAAARAGQGLLGIAQKSCSDRGPRSAAHNVRPAAARDRSGASRIHRRSRPRAPRGPPAPSARGQTPPTRNPSLARAPTEGLPYEACAWTVRRRQRERTTEWTQRKVTAQFGARGLWGRPTATHACVLGPCLPTLQAPPALLLSPLSRCCSWGREVGLAMRRHAAVRNLQQTAGWVGRVQHTCRTRARHAAAGGLLCGAMRGLVSLWQRKLPDTLPTGPSLAWAWAWRPPWPSAVPAAGAWSHCYCNSPSGPEPEPWPEPANRESVSPPSGPRARSRAEPSFISLRGT